MVQRWGETWSEDHPHSERTGAIIAAAIRVQKALGPGVLEDAYKACPAHALRFSGLELGLLLKLSVSPSGIREANRLIRTWPLKDGGIRRVIRSHT